VVLGINIPESGICIPDSIIRNRGIVGKTPDLPQSAEKNRRDR
jgi:hypothetical protein